MPRWVSKALAVGPGLLVSTVLTWMVGALLPPLAGLALFVGGLLAAGLLLAGRFESAAAWALLASRPARPGELDDLAPALTLLCRAGLGPPLIELRVRPGVPAVMAGGMGRRTAVISSGLLEALADGALPQEQAAAVIGHAAALTRSGWVRCDAVIAFWSLPWQLLHAVVTVVATIGRRLPLTTLAWRARAVVIAIAVVQHLQQGLPALAVLIGVVGALSYAIPAWERRWHTRMVTAGDRLTVQAGLAGPLAAYLRRCPATPAVRSRLRGITTAPARPIGLIDAR